MLPELRRHRCLTLRPSNVAQNTFCVLISFPQKAGPGMCSCGLQITVEIDHSWSDPALVLNILKRLYPAQELPASHYHRRRIGIFNEGFGLFFCD